MLSSKSRIVSTICDQKCIFCDRRDPAFYRFPDAHKQTSLLVIPSFTRHPLQIYTHNEYCRDYIYDFLLCSSQNQVKAPDVYRAFLSKTKITLSMCSLATRTSTFLFCRLLLDRAVRIPCLLRLPNTSSKQKIVSYVTV